MSGAIDFGQELIQLDDVGVCYPQRRGFLKSADYWALISISFSLAAGETLGLIGRNGVGKSTLLRLLADIITPDHGSISRKPGLRTVLLSLQAGFIPALSGRSNALLSGITLGLSKRQMEACLDPIIEFAELGDFIDQPVETYSAGMRARLGFSVAMQVDPDILLIDEVISVGDENFRQKSTRLIHERITANETTVLVTHNAGLARSLCTRVVWIEDGRVRMDGKAEDVLTAYQAN